MYHCDICNLDFKTEASLENHKLTKKHQANLHLKELNDKIVLLENTKEELEEQNLNLDQQVIIYENELNRYKIECEDIKSLFTEQGLIINKLRSEIEGLKEKENNTDYSNLVFIGGMILSALFMFKERLQYIGML